MGHAASGIVFHVLMPIGGIHEGNIQPLGVQLRLLQAMGRGILLRFGLDQGHGDGLGSCFNLNPEGIINPASLLSAWLAADDMDSSGGLLPANEILRPASRMQSRVDQLCSCVSFVQTHKQLSFYTLTAIIAYMTPAVTGHVLHCLAEISTGMGEKHDRNHGCDFHQNNRIGDRMFRPHGLHI